MRDMGTAQKNYFLLFVIIACMGKAEQKQGGVPPSQGASEDHPRRLRIFFAGYVLYRLPEGENMLKKCPVCGKKWDAKGNALYCSSECRSVGIHERRKRWEERSGYRASEAQKRRAQREKARTEENTRRAEAYRLRQTEEAARHAEDAAKRQQDLIRRYSAGDPLAGMILAKQKNDDLLYWQCFQAYEMDLSDQLENSRRTVNGISIFTDHFPELVIESIRETGRIDIRS